MNEPVKTMTFFGVAILIGAVAWLTSPGASSVEEKTDFRENIFPNFTDSTLVGSLEVVSLQDDKVNIEPFSVQLKDGVWTIPSHSGYPADAEDQVVKAAGTLIDLSIVKVVSKNKSSETYRRYGVMEPTAQNLLQYGSDSIGIHATMKDRKGEPLADLIIGKKVEENAELRYVRAVGQDRVVTVKIDPDKLSTRFDDWIETDLLKLSGTSDIRRVDLKDYSVAVTPQRYLEINEGSEITLSYDDEKSKWNVEDLKQRAANSDKLVDAKLKPEEELNDDTLRDLRDALGDLKIINVDRKPEAFRNSLAQDGKVKPSREAALSLQSRGFYLLPADDDNRPMTIKSTDGEVECTMKDGVRYVLRFGNVESLESSSDKESSDDNKPGDKKTGDDTDDDDDDDEPKLNRYLFVMAEFDPSIIPVPEYEALPVAKPAKTEPEKTEPAKTEPEKTEPEKTEPAKAVPEKTEPAKSEPKKTETDKPAPAQDKAAGDGKTDGPAATDSTTTGDQPRGGIQFVSTGDEPAEEGVSDSVSDGASDDRSTAQEKPAAEGDAKAAPKDDAKTKADEAKKKLEAEIDRVTKANESKKKAYEKQLAAGKKHVKDLNERFADWYYVISDDVYKKIHLGRDDIVKKKEKAKDDADSESKSQSPNFDPAPIDAPVPGDKKPPQ